MNTVKEEFKGWEKQMKKDFKFESKIESLWDLDEQDKRDEEEE